MSTAILLSGGLDSAYCALHAVAECVRGKRHVPRAIFFDYGQPYLREERAAVDYVVQKLDLTLVLCRLKKPIPMDAAGRFDMRNERLIEAALELERWDGLFLGTRNLLPLFDRFGDSNRLWANAMERRYGLRIHTPALMLPKFLIRSALHHAGLDLSRLFSTEGWRPSSAQ